MALRDTDPAEIGGYRIEDRLGSGGMGVVYLARSASGRRLAVKVVHGQYADDDEFRARFSREVAAARQVSGAFTAPVVDADADAPRPWMATLYIPGEDLGTHVRRHGPLPPHRLRELAAGLAEALRDIHRAGVVHRDLKPANVMLAEDGPRVIDFGVSRAVEPTPADALTQTGRVMGTPPFMSPEQFTSPHEVGPATDVFSLGAVVVYAATRRGPFDSETPWETATRVVEVAPDLDAVPADLLPFVRLCLEKHPKSRPTPDELLHLLREGRLPAPPARPVQEDTRPVRPRRRRGPWLVALAGALVLAVAGSVAALRPATDAKAGPRGDLPPGWRAWQAQETDKETSAGAAFPSCTALDGGLICAGDGLKAVRFSLATGKVEWSRPSADHPDPDSSGSTSDMGLLGTHGHDVYTVAETQPRSAQSDSYAFQALDARTGKVRWSTPNGDTAPTTTGGSAAVTADGPIVVRGDARTYSLLDPATGTPRWKRTLPAPNTTAGRKTCQVGAAQGRGYVLCLDFAHNRTTIASVGAAHGETRWTVTADGILALAGSAAGRLVLVPTTLAPDAPDSPVTERYGRILLIGLADHAPHIVPLARAVSADATPTLLDGTLYLTVNSGEIRAVDPATGRTRWDTRSSVERPGPPAGWDDDVLVASPGGRLAALDRRTGREVHSLPGRDDRTDPVFVYAGSPPVVRGAALYVPYGTRAVYSVDLRHL
ncbi:PQQ-binding-like beta-propeller repeat protein [Streptomyces sp. NPDC046759]|uniref:serine/threonine-protein kinase n=1 Tax=Streptomyces sp. NPDC046759 TaxID=3155019 RepID=UPI0033D6110E